MPQTPLGITRSFDGTEHRMNKRLYDRLVLGSYSLYTNVLFHNKQTRRLFYYIIFFWHLANL